MSRIFLKVGMLVIVAVKPDYSPVQHGSRSEGSTDE
jgi:hypothetical protein